MAGVRAPRASEPGPAARLMRALARFVLAAVPLLMGSEVGQWLQEKLAPAGGTPYDGALLVGAAGAVIGLTLALRGLRGMGWRRAIADLALWLLAAIWLLGVGWRGLSGVARQEFVWLWVGALVAGAVVAALGR
ncbi:MAG: hypothetical protein AB7Y46_16245 [Armatimonadota bacterium]